MMKHEEEYLARHYDWTVAAMALVETVTAGISGSAADSFTSLAVLTADSDTGADAAPLLLAEADSSSIAVYITSQSISSLVSYFWNW